MSAYHLRTFYLGRQTTWGTAVTPTVRLEGVTDGSVTVNIEDDVVETIGVNVGHITMRKERESEITISLVATYEQIHYVLDGLFGTVQTNDNNAPYSWIYNVFRTNTANPQIYTIEYGINNAIYQLADCLLSEVSLKGEVNGALELETTFICPNEPAALGSAPSVPPTTVNAIHVREAEFYLSAATASPFSTQPVEATLISFEININPNRHIKRFIGNDTGFGDGKWEIDGSFVLEFNSASKAVIDDALDNLTIRNLGLQFTLLPPSANRSVSILMPFIITDSFELFSDRDGNATVELNVKAVYNADSTTDTALRITVQTPTNTLP